MDDIVAKIAKAKAALSPSDDVAYEFPSNAEDIQARIAKARAALDASNKAVYEFPSTSQPVSSEAVYEFPSTSPPVAASAPEEKNAGFNPYATNDFLAVPRAPAPAPVTPPSVAEPEAVAQAPAPVMLQPAPMVKVRDAGWQNGTRSEQTALGMKPEELAEAQASADEAYIQRKIANQKELEIAKERGEYNAAYAVGAAQVAKDAAASIRIANAERDAYVQRELKALDESASAIKAKVDPGRYWKEAGTAGQIGLALSMALGQLGAALTRSENAAMRIIEHAIDNDIKAQQIDIETSKDAYNAKRNNFAQNLAMFGDKERAILATRANALDALKAQLDANVAKLGTPEAEARAAKLEAQINDERAKIKAEFAEKTHDKVVQSQTQQWSPAQYAGGPGSGPPPKSIKDLIQLDDGTALNVPDDKRRAIASEKLGAISEIKEVIAEAVTLREVLKKESLTDVGSADYRAAYKRLEKLSSDLAAKESVLNQQGALAKEEMTDFKQSNPFLLGFVSPSSFVTDLVKRLGQDYIPSVKLDRAAGDKLLASLPKQYDRRVQAVVRASGGTVVKPAVTLDKYGDVAPTYVETGLFNRPDVGSREAVPGIDQKIQPVPSLEDKLRQQQMPLRGPRGR
jgi:hypothetical protein